MNLFGRSKKQETPTTEKAIEKLKTTQEMLQKRIDFLEIQSNKERSKAAANAQKNKKLALLALKKKKMYESEVDKLTGTMMTIEEQVSMLQSASVNMEAFSAIQGAASTMKQLNKNMNVDQVDAVKDDIRDQYETAKEISDAISTPSGFGADIDEDELEDELEQLMQEELDAQLGSVEPPSVALPTVPTATPTAAMPDVPTAALPAAGAAAPVHDELAELAMWGT